MEKVSQEHLAFMKQIELENKQTILEYQNYSIDNFYNQGGFYDLFLTKKARENFIDKCIDLNKYSHTNATFLRIVEELKLTKSQQITLLSDIQYHLATDENKRSALANPMIILMSDLKNDITNSLSYTDHATCFCSDNFLDFKVLGEQTNKNISRINKIQNISNDTKVLIDSKANENKNQLLNSSEWIWLNKISIQATSSKGAVLIEIPRYHGYGIWINDINVRYPNPVKHPNNPTVGLKIEDNQIYKLNKLWNFQGELTKTPPNQLTGIDLKPLLVNKQQTQQRNYHKWEHAIPHDNNEIEKNFNR